MSSDQDGSSRLAFHKYDVALTVIRQLRAKGHTALLAGGCVRDILMRRRAQDYDVVTSARPEEVKAAFEHTIPVGEKFGVVKVVEGGVEFEVATFRSDQEYKDGRHPEGVVFTTMHEDAMRRDFTINGMFYEPVEGKVIDYVGGQVDVQQRVIRAIGDADARFNEDYLRMLRGVRFATTLDFKIVGPTLKAIVANAEKITEISPERIRGELELILVSPRRATGIELLDSTGLLAPILPEVAAGKGVKQGKKLHPEGDVWQHTILAMSLLDNPSFEFALAVLLHDVGKPVTADPDGEHLFLDHERVGEKMVREIAARLKLSKRETETVAWLVRYHMTLKDAAKMRKSTLKRVLGHELFQELAEMHRIDAMASNKDLTSYNFAMEARKSISEEALKPAALVNGEDLAAIGVARGPLMGKILSRIYTAQLDEQVKTKEEALELAAKLAAETAKE
jgi:poly(A) polymerase